MERIGAGGFGAVYKAWDAQTNRAVAIKACTLGEEMHPRFLREAELAGALRHPNITEVYESGVEGDTPFIVQELLGRRRPLGLDRPPGAGAAIFEDRDHPGRRRRHRIRA